MRVERVATAGSVVSGIFGSACCIGPLVFMMLGLRGAALVRRIEPFRPYLLVLTFALLGSAFYFTYRPRAACSQGGACKMRRTNRLGKVTLSIATILVLLATMFPWYAQYLSL